MCGWRDFTCVSPGGDEFHEIFFHLKLLGSQIEKQDK